MTEQKNGNSPSATVPVINVRVLARNEVPEKFTAPLQELRVGDLVSVAIRSDILVSAVIQSIENGEIRVVTDLQPIAKPGTANLELALSAAQLMTATSPYDLN